MPDKNSPDAQMSGFVSKRKRNYGKGKETDNIKMEVRKRCAQKPQDLQNGEEQANFMEKVNEQSQVDEKSSENKEMQARQNVQQEDLTPEKYSELRKDESAPSLRSDLVDEQDQNDIKRRKMGSTENIDMKADTLSNNQQYIPENLQKISSAPAAPETQGNKIDQNQSNNQNIMNTHSSMSSRGQLEEKEIHLSHFPVAQNILHQSNFTAQIIDDENKPKKATQNGQIDPNLHPQRPDFNQSSREKIPLVSHQMPKEPLNMNSFRPNQNFSSNMLRPHPFQAKNPLDRIVPRHPSTELYGGLYDRNRYRTSDMVKGTNPGNFPNNFQSQATPSKNQTTYPTPGQMHNMPSNHGQPGYNQSMNRSFVGKHPRSQSGSYQKHIPPAHFNKPMQFHSPPNSHAHGYAKQTGKQMPTNSPQHNSLYNRKIPEENNPHFNYNMSNSQNGQAMSYSGLTSNVSHSPQPTSKPISQSFTQNTPQTRQIYSPRSPIPESSVRAPMPQHISPNFSPYAQPPSQTYNYMDNSAVKAANTLNLGKIAADTPKFGRIIEETEFEKLNRELEVLKNEMFISLERSGALRYPIEFEKRKCALKKSEKETQNNLEKSQKDQILSEKEANSTQNDLLNQQNEISHKGVEQIVDIKIENKIENDKITDNILEQPISHNDLQIQHRMLPFSYKVPIKQKLTLSESISLSDSYFASISDLPLWYILGFERTQIGGDFNFIKTSTDVIVPPNAYLLMQEEAQNFKMLKRINKMRKRGVFDTLMAKFIEKTNEKQNSQCLDCIKDEKTGQVEFNSCHLDTLESILDEILLDDCQNENKQKNQKKIRICEPVDQTKKLNKLRLLAIEASKFVHKNTIHLDDLEIRRFPYRYKYFIVHPEEVKDAKKSPFTLSSTQSVNNSYKETTNNKLTSPIPQNVANVFKLMNSSASRVKFAPPSIKRKQTCHSSHTISAQKVPEKLAALTKPSEIAKYWSDKNIMFKKNN